MIMIVSHGQHKLIREDRYQLRCILWALWVTSFSDRKRKMR